MQTLFQIPRANARRVQRLYHSQGFFKCCPFHHLAFGKREVIHDALKVAAQVPRLVQVANDVVSQFPGFLRNIKQAKLRMQPFKKGRSARKRNGLVLDVRPLVSGTQPVIRRLVIEIIVKIKIVKGFALFL